jgi:hypothetical protein
LLLSGLLSQENHAEAMKFALRSLGGCALFFACTGLVGTRAAAIKVSTALVAGSCISALSAVAEIFVPGAAGLLMGFKTQPSFNGAYLRASGTFQYANIASMYWESTLPLALLVPHLRIRGKLDTRETALGFGSCVLLIAAIVLSSSRAGILIAALILVAFVLISFAAIGKPLRWPATASLIFLVVLVGAGAIFDRVFLLRLTTSNSSGWYRVEFRDFPAELSLEAGGALKVSLTVRNSGRVRWTAKGRHSATVSYHWLNPISRKVVIWQGARSEFKADVEAGDTAMLDAWVIAPASPGEYLLQWDMLQETVAWFSVMPPGGACTRVRVTPTVSPQSSTIATAPAVARPSPVQPGRQDLWRVALSMWRMRPLFGVGPDNFRHLRGPYLGLKEYDDRIHANNLYLETLATVGLTGFVAFAAVLIALAARLRQILQVSASLPEKLLILGLGISLAAFLVHGLVDYFLPFTPTYAQFWLVAGMAAGLPFDERKR